MSLVCVLQFATFTFENLRQKDNAAHNIHGSRSVGDVSAIFEPKDTSAMVELMRGAWGGRDGDEELRRMVVREGGDGEMGRVELEGACIRYMKEKITENVYSY